MTWFSSIEQASVANLTKPDHTVVKKQGKCFEKRIHQGLQLNEIRSNHPQMTSYEFCKTNELQMKVK